MNNSRLGCNKIAVPQRKKRFYTRKPFIALLAVLAVLGIFSNKNSFAQRNQTVELKVVKSFPDINDEVILAGPTDIDIDEEGNIYVCDYVLSSILKFSSSGKYITRIGRAGQGPGEFTNPSVFRYANGKIYIIDQANRRIQWMSPEGSYIGAFKVVDNPRAIALYGDKIYSIHINFKLHWSSDPQKPNDLIWVFDEKGRRILSFGNHLDFYFESAGNLSPAVSISHIEIFNNQVYVLFVYYPILRIYTLEGKLQKEIHFDMKDYAKRASKNYKWKNFQRRIERLPFKGLFQTFHVNELGIFVGLSNPDGLIIDQFDYDGDFRKRYTKEKKAEEYHLRDFIIIPTGNNKGKFYILNEDGLPTVDICVE